MKGLALRSLSGVLRNVEAEYASCPVEAIRAVEQKFGPWYAYMMDGYDNPPPFTEVYHRLPLQAFEGFSFDELCKLYVGAQFAVHRSVETLFEKNARYEVVRKIKSSMWRWSAGKDAWNDLVDAYDCIRNFSLMSDSDFELRLDHSTYNNEFGAGKYSRRFLDGAFAYLVYYKRVHVLTIGFSIMTGRQVLLQQVQLVNRTGNRWLYSFSANRLEFVISKFLANFPGYTLYLVDGASLCSKTLADYGRQLHMAEASCKRYMQFMLAPGADTVAYASYLENAQAKYRTYEQYIAHLQQHEARLVSFYANTGRYTLGESLEKKYGLVHRRIVASACGA